MSEVSKLFESNFILDFLFYFIGYRFATELSGRKARRQSWVGLAEEMAQAGWFDT